MKLDDTEALPGPSGNLDGLRLLPRKAVMGRSAVNLSGKFMSFDVPKGSDPAAEWQETEAKMEAFVSALTSP